VGQEDLMSFFALLTLFLFAHCLNQCGRLPAVQHDQHVMCIPSFLLQELLMKCEAFGFAVKYCFLHVRTALLFSQKKAFVKGSLARDGRR